jgi:hypothetical protein
MLMRSICKWPILSLRASAEDPPVRPQSGLPETSRVNGTYHAADVQRERSRRSRVLIVIGGLVALVGTITVVLINAEMTRLERTGPERLALAGGGIEHFVPSILLNLPRANQPPTTVSVLLADDPRRSPAFIELKRALERWMAVTGVALSVLFIGLESTIPATTARPRSPTGTDMARLVLLLSLAYGGLSFFENG